MMASPKLLVIWALTLLSCLLTAASPLQTPFRANSPAVSTLTYDRQSIKIAGQRVYLFSAEFHPWRLPVPSLWKDALYKLKVSGGYNTVSIYTHFGLLAPSPTALDLEGINDLGLFLDIAKEVGLMVNVRLGPYINAETTCGGLPGWVQRLPARLRTNDTAFTEAWKPYVSALGKIIASRQMTLDQTGQLSRHSGTVIIIQLENEYFEDAYTKAYVQLVKDVLHDAGVNKVLYSYNEASAYNPNPSFAKIVDLYGVDAYPQRFDCSFPEKWNPVNIQYQRAQDKFNLTSPKSLWEFQAGSFDPFGGAGYEKCYDLTNERFARVFDHANLAMGFKILSHYMAYGGTNWGNLAEPTVYTSYDYGAPLSEERIIRNKLREYALLSGFLRGSSGFAGSIEVKQGVNLGVQTASDDKILVYHRRAQRNEGDGNWYIVRQNESTSENISRFRLSVVAGGQERLVPVEGDIVLDGRDSKIISTNHALSHFMLLYSTAGISFSGKVGARDVLVLQGDPGQTFEAVFRSEGESISLNSELNVDVKSTQGDEELRLNWSTEFGAARHVQLLDKDGHELLLILADTSYAYTTQPVSLAEVGTLAHILVDSDVLLISGGYHFATASLNGSTLHLTGQSNESTVIDIIAPITLTEVGFNGVALEFGKQASRWAPQRVYLPGPTSSALSYRPPPLTEWSYSDSLPEVSPAFDDSHWKVANHTWTSNAYFYVDGIHTGGHVLFSSEYGSLGGHTVWRGRFNATGDEERLEIRLQGGSYFAGSVWLNGHHLGSTEGNGERSDGVIYATIKDGILKPGAENLLTVLHDSRGFEEDVGPKALGAGNDDGRTMDAWPSGAHYPLEGYKIPRGIISYEVTTSHGEKSTPIHEWRVQGNHGGESCGDKVRKCLNEGGLYGEVAGWHLPGYDVSSWPTINELKIPQAGVRFFTTEIKLDTPLAHDIPMSVRFPEVEASMNATYRANLYVNGWQFGKRLARFGPQTRFPIPPGVLDPRGPNRISVALWSLDGPAVITGGIQLTVDGVFFGDVEYEVNNPSWQELRG